MRRRPGRRPASLPEPAHELSLAEQLRARIAAEGPISVADYMAAANAHYYATRDPFGAEGDFVTAPEISQMFGELVGLWLADMWLRAGRPAGACYVELGPGRGTLADDALRAMRGVGLHPSVDLVETSPVLRSAQRDLLPAARWHDGLDSLPGAGPLLLVANEFFDALPIRQYVRDGEGWRELMVVVEGDRFVRSPSIPDGVEIVERSPATVSMVTRLCELLGRRGGAALIIDYGHERRSVGDTLQAVTRHAFGDPWAAPGEQDLTAHVDFESLCEAARQAGVRTFGPVGQGAFLRAMGLDLRTASLAKAAPERTEELVAARERLSAPDQMGTLFKALALVAPGWPVPEGF